MCYKPQYQGSNSLIYNQLRWSTYDAGQKKYSHRWDGENWMYPGSVCNIMTTGLNLNQGRPCFKYLVRPRDKRVLNSYSNVSAVIKKRNHVYY